MLTIARRASWPLALSSVLLGALSACGETPTGSLPPSVAIGVAPTTATVSIGGTATFTATVSGSSDVAVIWSVLESGCGSVTQGGVYSAPITLPAGVCHVAATSHADATKSAIAVVTVSATPVVSVSLSPTTAAVSTGGTATFTATVSGSTDVAVIWSIQEASGCGSVTQGGVYTAPATVPGGACHVVATSHADATKSSVAVIAVSATPVVSVSLSPTTATVPTGGTVPFTATVSGSSDVTVAWSIQEASGCGSVTQGGVYTAPVTVPGRACHVVATSHADATRSAVAVITVSSSGTAATLEVRGRDLVDTCGSRLVIRGVDQIFGVADTAGNGPFSLGGSYTALVDQIALTGANAIRIQPQTDLPASDVDAIIGQAVQHNMVVYVSNNGLSTDSSHLYSTTWIANPDIRAVLLKPEYAAHLIIDALPEPPYDDRARWRAEAISQIAYARGLGYTHPLALMGNLYGRDLPAILSEGAAILATDPLRRVQFIWEAYWGPPYESRYGMTLTAGLNAAAAAAFPIGFGLINWSEVSCSVLLDYQANMATAQANGLSWTWWDWVLPGYRCFDLSTNGFANSLTTAGQRVVNGPNGIAATSQKACGL